MLYLAQVIHVFSSIAIEKTNRSTHVPIYKRLCTFKTNVI